MTQKLYNIDNKMFQFVTTFTIKITINEQKTKYFKIAQKSE
jgi:hypothetical protein